MFLIFTGILLLYITYLIFLPNKSNYFRDMKDIILLVIAHPDDECMFFAPTILNLLKEGYTVYLLCLSAGGFYGKSSDRKKELRESCRILGLPSGNIIIIEHSKLPDNPDFPWNQARVALIIRKYFLQLSAKIIFSFDENGVSGHLNHIAIHSSLRYLKAKGLLPRDSQVFLLKSVYLLEKYLAFLCLPLSHLCSSLYFISNFEDIQKTWAVSVKLPDGRETSMSIRHLAPRAEIVEPTYESNGDMESPVNQNRWSELDGHLKQSTEILEGTERNPEECTLPDESVLPEQKTDDEQLCPSRLKH